MKVRIKILWKLQVKNVEVDGFKLDSEKIQQILLPLRMLGKAWFLVSFRKRNELLIVWPTTGADQDKYSHSFKIYSYAGRNYIITIL